jgi:serine/threonine protein kinase
VADRSTGPHKATTSASRSESSGRTPRLVPLWQHPLGDVFGTGDGKRAVMLTMLDRRIGPRDEDLEACRSSVEEITSLSKGASAKPDEWTRILRVVDVRRAGDGRIVLTTPLLEGLSLQDTLGSGRLSTARVIAIVRQLCHALRPVHRVGLHHGALSTASVILVTDKGRKDAVRLVDIGVGAIFVGPFGSEAMLDALPLTPEHGRKEELTPRSDIYRIGALAHTMLTGKAPFSDTSGEAVLRAHLERDPPALSGAAAALASVVSRCMSKDPAGRFDSVDALETAVCQAQADASISTVWDDLERPAGAPPPPQKASSLGGPASSLSKKIAPPPRTGGKDGPSPHKPSKPWQAAGGTASAPPRLPSLGAKPAPAVNEPSGTGPKTPPKSPSGRFGAVPPAKPVAASKPEAPKSAASAKPPGRAATQSGPHAAVPKPPGRAATKSGPHAAVPKPSVGAAPKREPEPAKGSQSAPVATGDQEQPATLEPVDAGRTPPTAKTETTPEPAKARSEQPGPVFVPPSKVAAKTETIARSPTPSEKVAAKVEASSESSTKLPEDTETPSGDAPSADAPDPDTPKIAAASGDAEKTDQPGESTEATLEFRKVDPTTLPARKSKHLPLYIGAGTIGIVLLAFAVLRSPDEPESEAVEGRTDRNMVAAAQTPGPGDARPDDAVPADEPALAPEPGEESPIEVVDSAHDDDEPKAGPEPEPTRAVQIEEEPADDDDDDDDDEPDDDLDEPDDDDDDESARTAEASPRPSSNTPSVPTQSASELAAAGKRARAAGNTTEAISLFRRALAKDSRNLTSLEGLALIYFNKGDYKKVVQYGKRAVALSPNNVEYRTLLGDAYFKLGRYADARVHYEKAAARGHAPAKTRLDKVEKKLKG